MKYLKLSFAALTAVLIYSCSGKTGPEAVTESYLTAVNNNDSTKIAELLTRESKDTYTNNREIAEMFFLGMHRGKEVKDIKCEVSGDTTAVCSFCCASEDKPGQVNLVKEGNDWKVDWKKEMPDMESMMEMDSTMMEEVPSETIPDNQP